MTMPEVPAAAGRRVPGCTHFVPVEVDGCELATGPDKDTASGREMRSDELADEFE